MGAARSRVHRRRRVRASCAACARWRRSPKRREPRKLALAVIVREMGRSLRDLEPALNAADGMWVRAFKSRLHNALPPAVAADLPDWLWERLGEAYGDADARGARARVATPAPFDLRVNPLKTTRDEALAALAARRPRRERRRRIRRSAFASPAGRRSRSIRGSPTAGSKCRTKAASSIGYLVAPRRSDMVVDFCAGAGGKTLLLGALMRSQGRLYAFDVDRASACANSTPRLARSGLVQRASAGDRARARRQGQAARRQDRSRAGRRAMHRLRHAAPQSRSQVAAAGRRPSRSWRPSRRRSSPRRRRW